MGKSAVGNTDHERYAPLTLSSEAEGHQYQNQRFGYDSNYL